MQPSFTRLTPRAAITAVFGCFGAAVGSLAGSMPSIMRNAEVDSEAVGLGLTISTVMTVAAMSLGGLIARHASNRAVLLSILPAFGLVLLAYLSAQSPLWFFVAILPMGFAFGLTDLFMNAEAVAIEHDMRRPVFTAFHGAVSSGVAVMAICASYVSTTVGPGATGLLMLGLFLAAWVMVYRAIPARPLPKGTAANMRSLPHRPALIVLGISAGLIIAAETAALLWSAKLLDEQAPALAAIAGAGAAFFGMCNAAVRFPGDRLRAAFGDMRLMIGSLLVAIAGFAALGLTENFAASVAAFAFVGLGLGLLIPCIFALAARLVPENRAGALSFVSLLTAVPRSGAPVFFGVIAGQLGTGAAFALVAVALVVALLFLLYLDRVTDLG